MSVYPGIEKDREPDGLREIRSWASRSPDAARPGFRTGHRPPALRPSPRLASLVLLALLLFVAYAGYRFLQIRQGGSESAAVLTQTEQTHAEQAEPPAPVAAPTEALPDGSRPPTPPAAPAPGPPS